MNEEEGHQEKSQPYATGVKGLNKGDVIGALLRLDIVRKRYLMKYYLNGSDCGTAFASIIPGSGARNNPRFKPAISCFPSFGGGELVFSSMDFRYPPRHWSDNNQLSLHASALHHTTTPLLDVARLSSAILIAVQSHHSRALRALLESKANTERESITGMTPLHLAVSEGSEHMVGLLLDAGANVHARSMCVERCLERY